MIAAELRAALEGTSVVDEATGPTRNPYKGLRAFLEADAVDFFGREAVTKRLIRSLAEDDPPRGSSPWWVRPAPGSRRSFGPAWSPRSGAARSRVRSAGTSSSCCPGRTPSASSRPPSWAWPSSRRPR